LRYAAKISFFDRKTAKLIEPAALKTVDFYLSVISRFVNFIVKNITTKGDQNHRIKGT